MTAPPDPPRDEQHSNGGIQKPPRAEGWLIAVGVLILVGLLGHLLNQQRTSTRTPDIDAVEPPQRESWTSAKHGAAAIRRAASRCRHPQTEDRTHPGGWNIVTHKHRLRDCHGRLTFTRNRLRFESDEAEDSFDVGRDDVTVERDALRIGDKVWRFDFSDADCTR